MSRPASDLQDELPEHADAPVDVLTRRPPGRREQRKLATHRAIVGAAREMVSERGLDGVTVEEIAGAAGVSPRTFFNYFASKEEALVGVDPAILAELADRLSLRPADEGPVAALRAVLVEVAEPGESLRRWQLRDELVARHPALLPRHLAAIDQVRAALASALGDRMGIDAASDPTADMVVAAVMSALRAAIAWWQDSDRSRPLDAVVDGAFALVSNLDNPSETPSDESNQEQR